MRLTCQQDELARALQIVSRGIAQRTSLPILTCVSLTAEDERLLARGTDLEVAVECLLPASVKMPGTAVVSGKTLTEFVRRLPPGPIEVSFDQETKNLRVDAAKASIQLPVMPAEEFPVFPAPTGGVEFRLPAVLLREMIRQTIFATLSEDSRPFLSSILWEVTEERLRLVSTDINRLALRETEVEASGVTKGLIPVRALREGMAVFADEEEEGVVVLFGAKQVFFTGGGVTFSSRLVEAEFPQYEQVIPTRFAAEMVVDREALIAGLERAALVTETVKLTVTNGLLYLRGDDATLGQTFEELGVTSTGEDLQIVFSPHYLLEFLKVAPGDQVRFSFTGPTDRALLRPLDGEYYRYVVMPYQVNF